MAEQDFNSQVIEEYRANGGKVGGMFESMSLLLLHHTGANSGQERIAPPAYAQDGSRYVIFASKAGAPTSPDWYHNLVAHPQTTIEVGTETLQVTAEEVTGEERRRQFDAQVRRAPGFGDYQEKAGERVIPVIALTATRDAE